MKKLISIICIVVLLVGCSPKSEPVFAEDDILTLDSTNSPTPSPSPENTPASTPIPTLPPREDLDFRNAKWGDTPETVIAYETADFFYPDMEPILSDNALIYTGKISSFDTHIIYFFDSDMGLYSATYGIQESHSTTNLYITDYENLKELMKEKYGKPTEDKKHKLSTLADYTDDAGALKLGYVAYRSIWETDTTNIMMGMLSDNRDITTTIIYKSKTVIPKVDTSGL